MTYGCMSDDPAMAMLCLLFLATTAWLGVTIGYDRGKSAGYRKGYDEAMYVAMSIDRWNSPLGRESR